MELAPEPPLPDNRGSRPNPAGLEEVMRSVPRHRSIVAIDIERSTSPERTNPIREELRHEAYRLLGTALRTAGITDVHCDPLADRGDGVLVLISAGRRGPEDPLAQSVGAGPGHPAGRAQRQPAGRGAIPSRAAATSGDPRGRDPF